MMANSQLPLCVDLDGTLISTDALVEAGIALVKKNPLTLLALPFWLLKGKAYAKRKIALGAPIPAELLPYRADLLAYLKEQKMAGRTLVLITASDELIAQAVNKHLGLFNRVMGSDGQTNLSAKRKAVVLTSLYGEKGFSYAGNASADLAVWTKAGDGIVVGSEKLVREAKKVTEVTKIFSTSAPSLKTWLKEIRIHQWVKNILLFVPLVAGHQLANISAVQSAMLAFLSFSFMASAIYLGNDLFDISADRRHVSKRFRPLAAGNIHPLMAVAVSLALAITSILLAWQLPALFQFLLGLYVAGNLAYSWYLKQTVLYDVLILASLYTLRIFAGSAATGIATSSWLFVFALFLFLSLALLKRVIELHHLMQINKTVAEGRGYKSEDISILTTLGIASGYLSSLVLALYISSNAVALLYTKPTFLWLLLPLLVFWVSRVWLIAHRGEINEDPVLFAIRDSTSWATVMLALIILLIAT